ncbi:hypothetical protein [Polymorphobacter megasporae]|uniref:hypothetical protein n=1 Tax=Glacieibacterium megasporae TaxID=2835787 RepID=UPI001C1E154A|nr:hypothetical protein [Polymorphobacter megasporae]UAJ11352.1 hypothetical protein KTC28_06535 [Polymorphobacter megasporae]
MTAGIRTALLVGSLFAMSARAQIAPTVDSPPPPGDVAIAKTTTTIAPPKSEAERYKTEVVCRSSLETGSLIRKRKSCLTRKQWEYVDQEHRDEARKLMIDNVGKLSTP